jgi:hypothetical protein
MILLTLALSAPVPPARPKPAPCVAGTYSITGHGKTHTFHLCPDHRYICQWDGILSFGRWDYDGGIVRIQDDWMGRPYPWHFTFGPGMMTDVHFSHGKVDFTVRREFTPDGRPSR